MQTAVQRLFFIVLSILTCFLCIVSIAQEPAIEAVPNQPSPEAYDLLKDSKGYLWVAHDQGVSRYDGAVFTNLYHPQQSSIAMTDLFEDEKGRIWCHNFSGQIFYIENLQLHLLNEYKYKEEKTFPRMVVCGDELVANSTKGVFTYNLITGKSTYYPIHRGTTTLTRVGKKVIFYGFTGWYSYESGKNITKLSIDNPIEKVNGRTLQIQNFSHRDTFYVVTNPTGIYYKMTLENSMIKVHGKTKTGTFINTVSLQDEKVWVHTKENSFTVDGKERILGMGLSDVLIDNHGNRWMSSLKKGLCVQYNAPYVRKYDDSLLTAGSDIRVMYSMNDRLFWGTSNGKLYQLDSSHSIKHIVSFSKKVGGIERIAAFDKDHILVATSLGLFSYNYTTKDLKELPVEHTVKDAAFHNGNLYLAMVSGIKAYTKEELQNDQPADSVNNLLCNKNFRCRSIAFTHDSLVAAYSDGVYIIHQNRLQPLLHKGKEIYATTVRRAGGKVLIGTFTQGLFILENGKLKNITEENGLPSNFIKNIKTIGGTTWLLYADRMQQLNADLTGVAGYPIAVSKEAIIDFGMLNNQLFITTTNGVYNVAMNNPAPGGLSTTFIDKIIANNTDLVTENSLKPFQNYLQFQVSTPFFSSHSKIVYQYRVKNGADSTWHRGAPGQDAFNLIVLEPGDYSFEIVATDINRRIISRPASYRFELLPAWYQHWLFKVLVALTAAAFVSYIVWLYYRKSLRQQQVAYERQLAIQAERHRISAEIHDDIGAGLSAIRLLAEITKNKLPESETKQEVGKIHASISELSYKMREVIWSLNTDNDHLENLLNYIRRQAFLLFESSPIQLKVVFPSGDIPAIDIKGQKRRHIYLSVKEALHNCLKHSGAQNCTLTMRIEDHHLYISVADDGRGFAPVESGETGNGLPGMKRRMQQINGLFEVETQESTRVQFSIPLNKNV